MLDTIELLETIGQDPALRHASIEDLARTLEQAGASKALRAAVMSGDKSHLSEDLGQKAMIVVNWGATHVSQGAWNQSTFANS